MNCQTAQRLSESLDAQRLDEGSARDVRQHLTECTDCRVQRQRAARLQQLLAVKRYERPHPQYFEGFLGEFHQRLAEAEARPRLWERLFGHPDSSRFPQWQYGLIGASAVALLLVAIWVGPRATDPSPSSAALPLVMYSPVRLADASLPASPATLQSAPKLSAASVFERSEITPAAGSVISTAGRAGSGLPRYVLDRIAITPASYDVASISF